MTKIVYNTCYGGFSLSTEAVELGRKLSGNPEWDDSHGRDIPRHDPILVQIVETLGKKANGVYASLAIHELPSGTLYRIDEYDGTESVMTKDDYKWETAP